jgi:hypothetical protein
MYNSDVELTRSLLTVMWGAEGVWRYVDVQVEQFYDVNTDFQ